MTQVHPRQRDADFLFGDRMKQIRQVRGWSQTKFAEMVGVHQSSISKIEAHDRTVNLTEALCICDVLRVTIDEMVRPGAVQVVTVA